MAFERYRVIDAKEALTTQIPEFFRPGVAARLEQLMTSGTTSPAQTAVIETDYIDVDYSASYHDQRGRSFTPNKRGTTRIHFFSEQFSKRSLINGSPRTTKIMQSSYLGFAVLRPERPTTLGRTAITCPTNISGRTVHFPTRGTTSVDLAGIPLEVVSCPYMSQDRRIMACATAALWMSTTTLVEKIPGVASHTTAEITAMAMSLNRPFGPVVGKRGLSVGEMEQALLRIGFDPRRHVYPSTDELLATCHLFSDSGIPPILFIEQPGMGHAVTVIGYTLGSSAKMNPVSAGVYSAHQFVPELVLHDDERGMYLLAEVSDVNPQNDQWKSQLTIHTPTGPEVVFCTAVLVPFPKRVMLDAIEVQGQAEEWITIARNLGMIERRDVVYRTLLVKSNSYKQTLLRDRHRPAGNHQYPKDLVAFARSLPMPRYIWLIEVSYLDDWDPADQMAPPVIMDFVLDSTSTESVRPEFLLAHWPGTALGQLVTETGTRFTRSYVSNDHPHRPFPDVPRP